MTEPFVACAVQPTHGLTEVTASADTDSRVLRNLEGCMKLLKRTKSFTQFYQEAIRLFVFPEMFLTGVPLSRTLPEYSRKSISIPGPVTDIMAETAVDLGAYICACQYEADQQWVGRFFNTAFIIDPQGHIILKYRKINGTILNVYTQPGDIYSEYVKAYGEDSFFPVVETPLGRLGCMIAYDVHFPEVARCLAMRGAEVILNPTAESNELLHRAQLCRQVRAYENGVYIVCANHGGWLPGHSAVIDFEGRILEQSTDSSETSIGSVLDIEALRRKRSKAALHSNFLPKLKASLYAKEYARFPGWPLDGWSGRPIQENAEAIEVAEQVLTNLYAKSLIHKPRPVGAEVDSG